MPIELQDGFGAMAAAAFCNAPLLPIHMVASVHAADRLGSHIAKEEAKMDDQELADAENFQLQGYSHSHF